VIIIHLGSANATKAVLPILVSASVTLLILVMSRC